MNCTMQLHGLNASWSLNKLQSTWGLAAACKQVNLEHNTYMLVVMVGGFGPEGPNGKQKNDG